MFRTCEPVPPSIPADPRPSPAPDPSRRRVQLCSQSHPELPGRRPVRPRAPGPIQPALGPAAERPNPSTVTVTLGGRPAAPAPPPAAARAQPFPFHGGGSGAARRDGAEASGGGGDSGGSGGDSGTGGAITNCQQLQDGAESMPKP